MWEISYLISKAVAARKLKFYKHLDGSGAPFGNDNFFAKGRLRGAVPPSVNLGPLISLSCFLFVDYFAFLHFFATFVVKVIGQGQM